MKNHRLTREILKLDTKHNLCMAVLHPTKPIYATIDWAHNNTEFGLLHWATENDRKNFPKCIKLDYNKSLILKEEPNDQI